MSGLSVCQLANGRTTCSIFMKLGGRVARGPWRNPFSFGVHPNHMADTLIIFRMSGIWLQVCPSSPTREGSGGRASQTGSATYLVRCILCNRETYIYLKDLMGFHGLLQSGHIPLSIFPWSYISSHCLGWSVSSRDHDKVPPDALQSVLVLRSAVSFTQHHLCVLRPQQGVVWWQGRLWLQLLHEKVLKY